MVIDDASAARIQKLLLVVTLVSYFPLILAALGVILLFVAIILACRFYKNKVMMCESSRITIISPACSSLSHQSLQ